MIGSTRSVQVWARRVPTDLRNGYNGLYGIVKREFDRDPLSGDAFLFVNKRRRSTKVLLWDGTGLCIYAKRLSKGTFSDVFDATSHGQLRMTTAELSLFLEGADVVEKLPISPEKIGLGTGLECRCLL